VLILKVDKAICFDALLQVLILNNLHWIKMAKTWSALGSQNLKGIAPEGKAACRKRKTAAEAAANYISS